MMPVPDAKAAAMKAAVEAAAMETSAMVETSAMKRHAATVETTTMEASSVEASSMKTASMGATTVKTSAMKAAAASMGTAATMTAAKADLGRRAIRNWSGRRHRGRIDRRHRLCALTSGSGQRHYRDSRNRPAAAHAAPDIRNHTHRYPPVEAAWADLLADLLPAPRAPDRPTLV
jgi:hypothetical protein